MKKMFTLFAILAMACTVNAASVLVFNRGAFQDEATLTVPLVYSGNAALNGWFINNETSPGARDCEVNTLKFNFPLYLTMCQPCIDCQECTLVEPTVFNLYWIETSVAAGVRTAYITKIDLLNEDYVFNAGNKRSNAGLLVENDLITFIAGGKKSDLTFKYFEADFDGSEWATMASRPSIAYIKSVTSFMGNVYTNDMPVGEYDHAVMTGTIKLVRNASLSMSMITAAFSSDRASVSKNWEDCSDPASANTCEEVFETDGYDFMDVYLAGKVYKKYTVIGLSDGE